MDSDHLKHYSEEKRQYLENALPIGTVLSGYIIDAKGKVTSRRTRDYKIKSVLGAGGFGVTYKVSAKIAAGNIEIDTEFCIKELFMKGCYRDNDGITVRCASTMRTEVEQSRADFITEAHRLNRLGIRYPNIIRVNEIFSANDTAYYVMEYIDGGDMIKCVKDNNGPLSESKALSILVPIAKAVAQLHDEKLLHLDIKPDNIILKKDVSTNTDVPVLIDFGIAKHFSSSGKPTSRLVAKGASDGYAPMEQYGSIDHFAPEIDVYALGATLYYLLTGKNPPKAFDVSSMQQIRQALPPEISERTADTIVAAMQRNKFDRTPTVKAFLSRIEKSYSLPIGYAFSVQGRSFRLVEIITENYYSITYKALEVYSLTGQGRANYGGVQTLVPEHYVIVEHFDKKVHLRDDSGAVILKPNTTVDTTEYLKDIANKAKIPLNKVVELYGEGYGQSEQFFKANNTLYYIYKVMPPQPWTDRATEGITDFFHNHGKKVIIGVASCLLVFGGIVCLRHCPSNNSYEDEYGAQIEEVDSVSVYGSEEFDRLCKEIDEIMANLPEDIESRVNPLLSAKEKFERMEELGQQLDFTTRDCSDLFDQIDKDFNELVGVGDLAQPGDKAKYYEEALMLKDDPDVRAKLEKLKK